MGSIEALAGDVSSKVLSFVVPHAIHACRSASRSLREAASDEEVWKDWVLRTYLRDVARSAGDGADFLDDGTCVLDEPCGPEARGALDGASSGVERVDSWRVAAERWHETADRVGETDAAFDGAAWLEVARAWRRVEAFCAARCGDVLRSLRPGASTADLVEAEPISRSLKYAYAVHDGQDLAFFDAMRRRDRAAMLRSSATAFHGLFGGFSAYNYVVCMRLLPLRLGAAQTAHARDRLDDARGAANAAPRGFRVFADGFTDDRETSVTDDDAGVHSGGGAAEPLCPAGPHAFARWFGEYARRLAAGIYRVAPIVPDEQDSKGIVLFADGGEDCAVATTRGVHVRASAVYIRGAAVTNGFAYSIRLSIIADANADAAACQLKTRHWRIQDGEGRPTEVRGEGVVGKFPVLNAAGWRDDSQVGDMSAGFARAVERGTQRGGAFVYQSFSGPMHSGAGSFEGDLEFTPGEVLQPTGAPFQVVVPRFYLHRPEFIY
ncbi:hypothetical protein M885DRAFT_623777 [Pelagophyceae sp. CCMP2097]|nr:hypothetical protein M885DRAFT_623777 [Pelagophyceae sp. CCMP2097]